MMGACGTQLHPLLLAPIGSTWSRAGGIQAAGRRRKEACPVVGVQRVALAPPPMRAWAGSGRS